MIHVNLCRKAFLRNTIKLVLYCIVTESPLNDDTLIDIEKSPDHTEGSGINHLQKGYKSIYFTRLCYLPLPWLGQPQTY